MTSKTFKVIFLMRTVIKNKTPVKVCHPCVSFGFSGIPWRSFGQVLAKSWPVLAECQKSPRLGQKVSKKDPELWPGRRSFWGCFGRFWQNGKKGQKVAKMASPGPRQNPQKCPKIGFFRQKEGFFYQKQGSILTSVDDKSRLNERPSRFQCCHFLNENSRQKGEKEGVLARPPSKKGLFLTSKHV